MVSRRSFFQIHPNLNYIRPIIQYYILWMCVHSHTLLNRCPKIGTKYTHTHTQPLNEYLFALILFIIGMEVNTILFFDFTRAPNTQSKPDRKLPGWPTA